jgi:hypothetical protein
LADCPVKKSTHGITAGSTASLRIEELESTAGCCFERLPGGRVFQTVTGSDACAEKARIPDQLVTAIEKRCEVVS